jgi:hypothetical protein
MLTPSRPLSRSLDLPVCLARFPAARLWLKDESLEDSANLPDPDIIAAEIIKISKPPSLKLKLARCPHLLTASLAALPSMSLIPFAPFAKIASDLKTN